MSESVLDASVLVEALTGGRTLSLVSGANAPAHVHVEVASALRSLQRRGALRREEAATAFEDVCELPIRTWSLHALLPSAWDLRDEFSIFDALYVALAVHLDLPLGTLDQRLARAAGRYCSVLPVH